MFLARWLRQLTSRRKPARRSPESAGAVIRPTRGGTKARRIYEDKMLRSVRDYEDKSA